MKYEVGDRVRIKSLDWYNENKDKDGIVTISNSYGDFNFTKDDTHLCGEIVTIEEVWYNEYYTLENDPNGYFWVDEMIEGLVEEEIDLIPKFGEYSDNEPLDVPTMTTEFVKDHGLPCPDGYIFKDENGNVINATKIVLEKKKKEVILTQEQIDTMVHESCVLFCKHYGCGVPRETCTSLGTCKDHDDYRKSIRTHFEKHKK